MRDERYECERCEIGDERCKKGAGRSVIRDCQMEDGTCKMREEGSRLEIEMRDARYEMRGARCEMRDVG